MMKLVVLSCVLAAATANLISPLGLGAPFVGLGAPYGGLGLASPLALGGNLWAPNYRGPLSLAPGQPANIIAADGRPLDTLAVNLDRAAHATAKAVDGAGLHLLKKRSAPLIAPLGLNSVALAPTAGLLAPAPLLVPSPLWARAPLSPLGLSPILSSGVIASPLNYGTLGLW